MIEIGGVEYCTPSEAADLLGVRRQNVVDWIRGGRIAPELVLRAGTRLLVPFLAAARAERATRGIGRRRAET